MTENDIVSNKIGGKKEEKYQNNNRSSNLRGGLKIKKQGKKDLLDSGRIQNSVSEKLP